MLDFNWEEEREREKRRERERNKSIREEKRRRWSHVYSDFGLLI